MSSISMADDAPMLERNFRGHRDGATCVDFNPNMKQLASGGLDCSVMLWNFKKNLRAFRLVGHKEAVTCVTFSRSGELLASASRDRVVRLWVPTIEGKSTALRHHMGGVRSVEFSPDDQKILTASDDKSLKVWDVTTQRFVASLSEHLNWVRSAKFSRDGDMVVSGSDDRTIKLWDPLSKACLHTFTEQPGPVLSVAFHPSDTCVAAAAANHVYVYDIRNRKLLQFYESDSKTVRSISFHRSGRYLLTGSDDAAVRILDLIAGRPLYTISAHTKAVTGVAFSRDGNYFSTAGLDSLVTVWKSNLKTEELPNEEVSFLKERRNKHNQSLREIDASMLLMDENDFEITNVESAGKNSTPASEPDGLYQLIQTLSQNVEHLTHAVNAMEKRVATLELKLEAQNGCNALNDTLNETLHV